MPSPPRSAPLPLLWRSASVDPLLGRPLRKCNLLDSSRSVAESQRPGERTTSVFTCHQLGTPGLVRFQAI